MIIPGQSSVILALYSAGPPEVAATSTNSDVTSDGNDDQIVDLPSGIMAGDLIIACVVGGFSSSRSISTPAGWTALYNRGLQDTSQRRGAGFYRIATGGEGSTLAVRWNNIIKGCSLCYLIRNYSGTPEASNAAGNSEGYPFPALSPSWGKKNTLWLECAHVAKTAVFTYPAPSSGYSDQLKANDTSGQGYQIWSARRAASVATETPGSVTDSGIAKYLTATIGIQPK